MTPIQALQFLDNALAEDRYEHNRRVHATIVEAVKVLHELINPSKEKKVGKRKQSQRKG